MSRPTLVLGLGSNLGDRAAHLRRAVRAIAEWPEVEAVRVSAVYETDHVGPQPEPAPPYLNACIALDGAPDPGEALRRVQGLEWAAGRRPDGHLLPRPLDVDLLLADDRRVDSPELTVPHPRMHERRFVLQPLCDLDPDLDVPGVEGTVADLVARPRVADQRLRRVDLDLRPSARAGGA